MKAQEVSAALERLRAAGAKLRRRRARETVASLAQTLEGWRDPDSPARKELCETLPAATGFSPEMVREGLARGLAPLGASSLHELVARELGDVDRLDQSGPVMISGFETAAVILAGAIPLPSFVSIVAPLVLRSPVLVKSSVHDPLTAPLVARSIAEVDPVLGSCVEVVRFRSEDASSVEALLAADLIVATGSNATIAEIAARVQPPRRLVARGHRMSVAVLGPEATRDEALETGAAGLAADVALWDQLGCLSPVAVYVVSPDEQACDRVAEALAGTLAGAEASWPRGRVDPSAAAVIVQERAEAEMRSAAGRRVALHAGLGTTWTVIREEDARPRPAPLHRFIRVHPVADPSELLSALRPLAAHLAGVALAGFGSDTAVLVRALAELGASRLCEPGALQAPPLAWHADNRGVLLPLARFSDRELA